MAARIDKLPKVAAVYASQLERARETAMPIARERGLAVRIDRGLMDLDVGTWTGERLDKVSKRPEWTTVQRHPSGFRFPDGESFMEMQARMTETLARLVERHRGGVVVAVSHADPIKAVVAHALGMHLDLFQRLNVDPASISIVRYTASRPYVLATNTHAGDLAWLAPPPAKKRGRSSTDAVVGGGAGPSATA